ncbi:uncharacterized protein LOC129003579 [Macrosteles quadrilineatus]|uniref:uncharacterized protein LOC129003579 n=1 Tax=Macrosteles quadrilineatus TaxID=74068 RepID=UPI0023E17E17|nr:uncharacterized protein LOC129003579 [Macrosteles quadrilineatus]
MKKNFETPDSQTVKGLNVRNLRSIENLEIHDYPYQNDDAIALCGFNDKVKMENVRPKMKCPEWKCNPAEPTEENGTEEIGILTDASINKIVGTPFEKDFGINYLQSETVLVKSEAVINSRPLVDTSFSESCVTDDMITTSHFFDFDKKGGALKKMIAEKRPYTTFKSESSPMKGPWDVWKKIPPCGRWKKRKMVELHSSRDGKIRSATVILSSKKKVVRPLNLLYPLEVKNY